MLRVLKAIAAAIIAVMVVYGLDVDLIEGTERILDALIAALVNGGIVWAVPNFNYPTRVPQ